MGELEPQHEIIQRGELFFLDHPGSEEIFSGYGLSMQPGRNDLLVGVLMVDRPHPADPFWLRQIEETFGDYQLLSMTSTGERGILCRMKVEPDSIGNLRKYAFEQSYAIQEALQPFLDQPPKPIFGMHWDDELNTWLSQIQPPNELPQELREIFEKMGYGCLAVEADIGIIHVCHASDFDITGFEDKQVISQWQLIQMPTAPLIRLELTVLDHLENPYRFESFLNVASEDQADILAQLTSQENLMLAFYGDDLEFQYAKVIPHDIQQWQMLDEITAEATRYWESLPPERRDYDLAKETFSQ